MLSLNIPLTFQTIAVASTGRLLDVGVQMLAALRPGQSVHLESVFDTARWDPTSTLAADNITICNPTANGANPGRFIRDNIPSPAWNLAWYTSGLFVDGAAGNDEWTGTAAANTPGTLIGPIKSDAERRRRITAISSALVVTNVTPPSDKAYWDLVQITSGSVIVQGTWAVTRASSFTGVTPQAGNTMLQVTDGAFAWGPLVGKIGRISTGPRAGNYFVVAKAVGAGVAELSPPFPANGGFTVVVPQIGDTYEILDQAATNLEAITAGNPISSILFRDMVIDPTVIHAVAGAVAYQRCQFPGTAGLSILAFGSSLATYGCSFLKGTSVEQSSWLIEGGAVVGAAGANIRLTCFAVNFELIRVPILMQYSVLLLENDTTGDIAGLFSNDVDGSAGTAIQLYESRLVLSSQWRGVQTNAQVASLLAQSGLTIQLSDVANMTAVGSAGAAAAIALPAVGNVAFTDAPVMGPRGDWVGAN